VLALLAKLHLFRFLLLALPKAEVEERAARQGAAGTARNFALTS